MGEKKENGEKNKITCNSCHLWPELLKALQHKNWRMFPHPYMSYMTGKHILSLSPVFTSVLTSVHKLWWWFIFIMCLTSCVILSTSSQYLTHSRSLIVLWIIFHESVWYAIRVCKFYAFSFPVESLWLLYFSLLSSNHPI